MPKEEKMVQDETPEEAPKPKSKIPMLLIIMAAGVFVIGIGVFSVVMGVFSSSPTAEPGTTPDSLAVQAEAADSTTDDLSELEKLEKEIFGHRDATDANDLDELMDIAEDDDSGSSNADSLAAASWIESEKAKLAKERLELDVLKKNIDAREAQIKQLLGRVNQIESNRLNSLAKLYDGMKPNQVAPLINKLSDEQAVQVLLKMKPANAAKILGALSPDRAALISANMITLNMEK